MTTCRHLLYIVIAVPLAAILAEAATEKMRRPWAFYASVHSLKIVPSRKVTWLIVRVVPWSELSVVGLLLSGIGIVKLRQAAMYSLVALLSVFALVHIRAATIPGASCGCFGDGSRSPLGSLTRIPVLAALTSRGATILPARESPGFGGRVPAAISRGGA